MNALVEHLAELTSFRDRDLLDVGLARALWDVLRPDAIAIYHRVGDGDAQCWLASARLTLDEAGDPAADGAAHILPPLASAPERLQCLLERQVKQIVGPTSTRTLFPMVVGHDAGGVLEVSRRTTLTPSECTTVTTVLRVIGNVCGLLDHSERDTLTGLLNRQTFDASFMKSLQRGPAAPARQALLAHERRDVAAQRSWLGVVDIDHFKKVNDTFGHLIGDEVLLLLSRLMRSCFRLGDRLYRFGGEEFVVLLDCREEHQAQAAFERLRRSVEHYAFPQVGAITISIGYTRAEASDTPSAAFSRADKALYHAKTHGRNQVVVFDDLARSGCAVEVPVIGEVELF